MATSKKSPSTRLAKYLIALALIGTLALGLAVGSYYEMRQIRVCECHCAIFIKKVPIT